MLESPRDLPDFATTVLACASNVKPRSYMDVRSSRRRTSSAAEPAAPEQQPEPVAFTPLEQAAWGGLLFVHGTLVRQLDADLQRDHRLSHPEFEVLLRLSWEPGTRMRLSDLAAASLLTLSGMSRLVGRLANRGLVTREDAPEDRRGAYAALTRTGKRTLRAARKTHIRDVRRRFLGRFTERELEALAHLWQRFRQGGDAPP